MELAFDGAVTFETNVTWCVTKLHCPKSVFSPFFLFWFSTPLTTLTKFQIDEIKVQTWHGGKLMNGISAHARIDDLDLDARS